MTLIGKAC